MEEIIVKNLKLSNFRIHESYKLNCDKKTTLVLGENGSGKTSVLEAIYIAMQGKSFRAVDREILRRKTDFYRVELEYVSGEKVIVAYEEKTTKKIFLVKDKKMARLAKQSKYPVVLFLPEDLHIIASSPTRRREYFDRILAQIDDKYSILFSRYNKTLKQRNELLKKDNLEPKQLFSWDILLAKYGVYIREAREKLIERINKELTETYKTIAENKDSCEIKYKSYSGKALESEYLKLLTLDYERDRITGHTNFGVHKDDYEFIFNNSPADGNASRGEVRSIILALKFIEARILEDELKKKPIVLLDDVFSELDTSRQKSLVKNFKNHQVILTSVEGVKL